MRPHVVLLGMPGAGKTTVGAIVAERSGLLFRDGDASLETEFGVTARTLTAAHGVGGLHAAEQAVARDLLADDDPSIIAPAASCLDDPATVDAIRARSWLVVVLDADAALLAERASTGAHRRPMGAEEATARWANRRPTALGVADVVLDATRSAADLAEQIAAIRAC